MYSITMQQTLERQKMEQAYLLGMGAFISGRKEAAPSQNKGMREILKGVKVGEAKNILIAYQKGWFDA